MTKTDPRSDAALSDKNTASDTARAAALFITHLDREAVACRSLLHAAEAKRAAVIANELPGIVEAADREEAAVAEMARLRSVRSKLFTGLGKAVGLPAGTPLRVLIGALAVERQDIADRVDALHDLAQRVEATNLGNQALLRHGLEVINGVLAHLAGGEGPADTGYGPKAPAERRQGFLDLKA